VALIYISNVVCSIAYLCLSAPQTHRWRHNCRNRKTSLFNFLWL